jgi:hypothetical protein
MTVLGRHPRQAHPGQVERIEQAAVGRPQFTAQNKVKVKDKVKDEVEGWSAGV